MSAVTLARFLHGEVRPGELPHREHLRMAFEVLKSHDFATAALHYANALRSLTARAGRPEAFNMTVTVAFLAVIAERLAADRACDFGQFTQAHPELFDRRLLERWYRPERLASPLARAAFVLPEPRG